MGKEIKYSEFDRVALRDARKSFSKAQNINPTAFWRMFGVSLSRGYRYENGDTALPETVKRVVYLHVVMGIPIDLDGAQFKHFMESKPYTRALDGAIEDAQELLTKAKDLISKAVD